MFNHAAISRIDPSTIESTKTHIPWIQWGNGNPKQQKYGGFAYTGGFFIPEKGLKCVDLSRARDILSEAGWLPETVFFGDGTTETPGWYATEIDFCVIARRRRWRAVAGRQATYLPYSWTVWETARKSGQYERIASQLQVLGLIRGAEQIGRITLTLSGSAAMSFDGTSRTPGIMQRFTESVLNEAYRQTKQRWPERLFFCSFGIDTDGDKPRFTKVGSGSSSTALVVPTYRPTTLDQAAVPDALIDEIEEIFKSSPEWIDEWAYSQPNHEAPSLPPSPAQVAASGRWNRMPGVDAARVPMGDEVDVDFSA